MTEADATYWDEQAAARDAIRSGHGKLVPDSNNIGFRGEAVFGNVFSLPVNSKLLPGGDKGIDFVIPVRFTVDVKTARNPLCLIVEVGKVFADIYVLAGYSDDSKQAWLIGWELADKVLRAPARDFGHGVINHYIEAQALRPIAELRRRVMVLM